MIRTLYAKLSLFFIALLIGIGAFYILMSCFTVSYYQQKAAQELSFDLAKNLVIDRKIVEHGKLNQKALSTTFMEYMVINPSIELYLIDTDGRILSYSAEPGKVKRKHISLTPINAFLKGENLPLLGDDPRSHDKQKIFSVTPVPEQGEPQGYLYIVLHGEQYDDAEQMMKESLLWQQAGIALAISLFITLIIGLIVFRKLTLRLTYLAADMSQFYSSDFNHFKSKKMMENPTDEIDVLSNTFNKMAIRLVNHIEERQKQEGLRRELVANISHDLRTPVAILHGYLETLTLKANTLTPQEQQNYIQQALQSSERLNTLITELFQLAKLDASTTVLNKSDFNLSELMHDIVQKFQLKATNNKIKLAIDIQKHSISVYADISLISRILENLLDNSFKFTSENEHINVSVTEKENSAIITVQDSGRGIPEKDLPRVFERFYQASNSNRTQPGGLGLAIVKRIVDLHQGTIEVTSTLEKGTVFTIVLPLHL